jgi:hypothetical protein
MLSSRLLARVERRIQETRLPLAVRLWDGTRVGADQARVTVTINSPLALTALANPSLGALASSYVEGRIDADGPIRDVVRVGTALVEAEGGIARAPRRVQVRQQGGPQSLRCRGRFLPPVAGPAARLFLRLFPPRRGHARPGAGAEARPYLPQAQAGSRRALSRHRLRLGRPHHLGGGTLWRAGAGRYPEPQPA